MENTILKFLQSQWFARRQILDLIVSWKISINDKTIENINHKLEESQKIYIKNGKIVKKYIFESKENLSNREFMLLLNKPKWYVVSKSDIHNKTIYELLDKWSENKWYYIGRLDKDSHWLVLLTTNPRYVDLFEQPSNKIEKKYIVVVDKTRNKEDSQRVKTWYRVDADGKKMHKKVNEEVEFLRFEHIWYQFRKWKHILYITLTEGKKRHIRRLLRAIWYQVKDLYRKSIWEYDIGWVAPGKTKMVWFKNTQ